MNADQPVSAAQHRQMFEAMIGSDPERNRPLWWALDRLLVAVLDERDEQTECQIDELARHFPSVAPAIRIVWDKHILTQPPGDVGRCCAVDVFVRTP